MFRPRVAPSCEQLRSVPACHFSHALGRRSGPAQSAVRRDLTCLAAPKSPPSQQEDEAQVHAETERGRFGLGDILGPIGLTLQGLRPRKEPQQQEVSTSGNRDSLHRANEGTELLVASGNDSEQAQSIHSMTTQAWRDKYEHDGCVDLWMEDEYNAGSRLKGGRATHKGNAPGFGSGEGISAGTAPRHSVTIHNHHASQTVQVDVPEDRYILWEAEDQGLLLPYACRMGCCTSCAVRVKSGEMHQPQSLGVSQEMKEAGYGLMCVGYPVTDLVLETVEEDEVYDQQFGKYFAQFATDPNNRENIARDDFALELADMDE